MFVLNGTLYIEKKEPRCCTLSGVTRTNVFGWRRGTGTFWWTERSKFTTGWVSKGHYS